MIDPRAVDKRFKAVGDNLLGDIRDGVNVLARAMQGEAMGNLAAATGGNFRLSGVRRRVAKKSVENERARIGVQMLPSRALKNSTAVVRGFPPGLFTIVEAGTAAHSVGFGTSSKNGFASSLSGGFTGRVTAKGNIGRRVDGPIVLGATKAYAGRKRIRTDRGKAEDYRNAPWVTGPVDVSGSEGKRPLGKARDRYRGLGPQIVNTKTEKSISDAGFRRG